MMLRMGLFMLAVVVCIHSTPTSETGHDSWIEEHNSVPTEEDEIDYPENTELIENIEKVGTALGMETS